MTSVRSKTQRLVRVALVMALVAATWILVTDEGGVFGLISLMLTILTGALLVAAMLTAIRGMDELQRRIQLEALALAFGGISLLAFVQIGLDEFGRPWIVKPGIFLLILDGLWMAGYFFAQRKYRA